jgi:uncharacterized protein (TIGR02145 family)
MNEESISKKISDLFDLYKSGAVSKEEYEKLKEQVLSELGIENIENGKKQEQEQRNTKPPAKQIQIKKGLWLSNLAIFSLVFIIIVIILIKCFLITTGPSSKEKNVYDRDGYTYHPVTIGTQVWLTENLKTSHYRDGTPIRLVTDNKTWTELTEPAYCWYLNEVNVNQTRCGALYNCYAINTNKLCPYGWHVPTDAEWATLTTYLGGPGIAGTKLETTDKKYYESPNTRATNESGFDAVPNGIRLPDGTFIGMGDICFWWSGETYCRYLDFRLDGIARGKDSYQGFGYSVRCIQDK